MLIQNDLVVILETCFVALMSRTENHFAYITLKFEAKVVLFLANKYP